MSGWRAMHEGLRCDRNAGRCCATADRAQGDIMSTKPVLVTAAAIAAVIGTCVQANASPYRHGDYHHTHHYGAFGSHDYAPYGIHRYPGSGPYFYPDAGALPARPHYGPAYANDDLIVRQPNGQYLGTDPDPNIRAYMHHDNVGPNVVGGGNGR
jgi:hypothetical protein